MTGKRNPVAQHNNEFNKPKTFRNRKKHPSKKQQTKLLEERKAELHHPVHRPYYRDNTNWTKEALDAEDIFREDTED